MENELKKYFGQCHCGNVKFEVKLGTVKELITCNCSICIRKGWSLTFVPKENFHLLAGESSLTDYQFGKKSLHHQFCSRCGTSCFSSGPGHDGKTMFAVNMRCVDGFDLKSVPAREFDGKNL